jgi:anti-sigma-K factor RskA
MNYANNPDLLDRLSASYALGNLRGGARRRFARLARENPRIRANALLWQERLSGLTELVSEQQPDPQLWLRIDNLVDAQVNAQRNALLVAQQEGLIARLGRQTKSWRIWAMGTGAVGAAAIILAANTQLRLQTAPQLDYIAVLADDKANASMLVTFDPKHQRLTLKRIGTLDEGQEKSLQLWALPTGGAPQSLGVLGAQQISRFAVQNRQVDAVPALAISLEPRGGVPSERGPTGPVLFKGALLQTPL